MTSTIWDGKPKKLANGNYLFGRYPQGENGEIEPIVWLAIEEADGEALLLSENILDCKKYHKADKDVTWRDCSLRKWLNGEFFKKAFTSQEQSNVITVANNNDLEKTTSDKAWLLSIDEAERLGSDERRATEGTPFAKKSNLFISGEKSWWWLRSRSTASDAFAAFVTYAGEISPEGLHICVDNRGVRVALKTKV